MPFCSQCGTGLGCVHSNPTAVNKSVGRSQWHAMLSAKGYAYASGYCHGCYTNSDHWDDPEHVQCSNKPDPRVVTHSWHKNDYEHVVTVGNLETPHNQFWSVKSAARLNGVPGRGSPTEKHGIGIDKIMKEIP